MAKPCNIIKRQTCDSMKAHGRLLLALLLLSSARVMPAVTLSAMRTVSGTREAAAASAA
jgi:hypothetical protein